MRDGWEQRWPECQTTQHHETILFIVKGEKRLYN